MYSTDMKVGYKINPFEEYTAIHKSLKKLSAFWNSSRNCDKIYKFFHWPEIICYTVQYSTQRAGSEITDKKQQLFGGWGRSEELTIKENWCMLVIMLKPKITVIQLQSDSSSFYFLSVFQQICLCFLCTWIALKLMQFIF